MIFKSIFKLLCVSSWLLFIAYCSKFPSITEERNNPYDPKSSNYSGYRFLKKFGKFSYPNSFASNPNNTFIVIVDRVNNNVQKFNSDGNFVASWSDFGNGTDEFSPDSIAVDANDNIYIANAISDNIVKLNSSGKYILKWGAYGTNDGEFRDPMLNVLGE